MNTLLMNTTLILSGGQVLGGLLLVAATLAAIIALSKTYLKSKTVAIQGTHTTDSNTPTLRKYEEVDFYRHNSHIKLISGISALAIVLIIFGWTQFTSEQKLFASNEIIEPIDMEVPITTSPPKSSPVLPPPPVKGLEIEITIEPIPEPTPTEPIVDPAVNVTPTGYTGATDPNSTSSLLPPAPKVIAPPVDEKPEILAPADYAEIMPMFPSCQEMSNDNYNDKKMCADKAMLGYIMGRVKYPQMARETGMEGIAVIEFVVGVSGELKDFKILRDPGAGMGKEALRVVKEMAQNKGNWTPGRQGKRNVPIRLRMPIRFTLAG